MPERHQYQSAVSLQTAILTAGIAVVGSNSLVLSPILGDVAAAMAATPVAVSRAIAAYGGATALSAFLLAPQIDRIGPRRALLGGMVGLAAATLLSALAMHWLMLAAAQALAGLGAGVILPSIYTLATTIAPPGRESRVLGRVLTGWSISMVAGVPAAALVAETLGWRAVFLVLAGLAGLALAGIARLPAPPSRDRGARPGFVALVAPLAYPGVPALLAICLGFMAAFYGVYAFIGDQVRAELGLTAGQAGLIVLTYGVGFGAASLGDGLVDRLGPRRLFPLVLLAVAVIYALMLPATHSFVAIATLTGLWGFANHFGLNILVLLLSQVKPEARGAVLGLNSAVTYLGTLIGTGLAGIGYAAAGFPPLATGAAIACVTAALIAATALRPRRITGPAAS
ncbi:MFS transporter [Mycobacterium sp. KBS0706]|uniref:MFS transporter n=1 Tax=Mycobacterium sp. KBS0706 TaxID=2578109 RepID=UPI00163DB68F|nr:MFS transporter [Mycobacterium sp. KBS0706]